ncbi:LysM peptidoglycan-binding domain-containing protein [Paenibacillus massiliensis]|uniref:LysM peptidoglycan-binding domain-containing protein n=1 Tax=Paenibacillus massiliensis TaxID=225917 RepID=UPI00042945C9|nr:LysM peptidoglycan-binding domain-containing protein [Paenibacillus massiliensis]
MIERYSWAPVGGVVGKRHAPIIRVSFHTEKTCYQLKGSLHDEKGQDPTSQVLSVTTQKTLDAPTGTMNIVLAGDKWFRSQLIIPNDLVVVQMGYKTVKGEELSTVMVGLVDRVRRTRSVDGGMTTSVQARDFGKVFIKSNIKFYPEVSGGKSDKFFLTENGWLAMAKYFQSESVAKGSPAVILDVIMRFVLPQLNGVKWTVWDETKTEPVAKQVDVTNIVRYNFASVPIFLPQFFTLDRFEGSLWNLMERTSSKPFTELFVDVREPLEAWNPGDKPRVVNETIEQSSDQSKAKFPKGEGYYPFPRFPFGKDNAVVSVFLRNTPFSKGPWEKLYTHVVTAEDVIDEDLSYSDDEHYNLFWAGTTINPFGMDLKRVAPPLMNKSAIERYGLSPLEVEVEGLAIDPSKPEDTTKLERMSTAYTVKLKEWFENNHKFLSGAMTVRGKGNYKIGQRLQAPGILKEFYIESVTQTFNVFEGWTTTLQLTRGRDYKPTANTAGATTTQASVVASIKSASAKTTAEIKADYYTVKSGDNLWSIAAKLYGSGNEWTKLWEANKEMLVKRDSRNSVQHGKYIYSGQILKIPGGST